MGTKESRNLGEERQEPGEMQQYSTRGAMNHICKNQKDEGKEKTCTEMLGGGLFWRGGGGFTIKGVDEYNTGWVRQWQSAQGIRGGQVVVTKGNGREAPHVGG